MNISSHDREICLRVLQKISEDPSIINDDDRMKALVAKIHTQGKKGQRRTARESRAAFDRDLRTTTFLVQQQRQRATASSQPRARLTSAQTVTPDLQAPDPQVPAALSRSALCYICKQPYTHVHRFYHLLCPECASLNWQKRGQRAGLHGRTALLTGGRIKIGYEVALRLLRDGARVLLTTRFPRDAARRFGAESGFEAWSDRLAIFGLDMRDVPSVEAFAVQLLETQPHLDIIIHNAAQTIKRPLAFYQHLLDKDNALTLPDTAQALIAQTLMAPSLISSARLNNDAALLVGTALLESHPLYPNEKGMETHFPQGRLDADGQQFDARPGNSWRLRLHEVSTVEVLEAYLVNAVAPFVLNAKLKPLLLRSPHPRRFIINVSAMEGQFARQNKTWFHPHTNMAKAALNMMTRTCANDLMRDGIYMNSVDTGWITDENPHPRASYAREQRGFYTPLDAIDGAARIYDPIAQGIANPEDPLFGHFLKDYAPYPW
jgi:NAD(P)-dependent dehydrogenase (short-subunit alcohol dehydrogenase family)